MTGFLLSLTRVLPGSFFLEVDMAYRSKMKKSKSRRDFSRKSGVHRKNRSGTPMRGGIRL